MCVLACSEDILGMEKQMLAALQYDLTVPTCYLFNARFRKAAGVQDDPKVCWLASPADTDAMMLAEHENNDIAMYLCMHCLSLINHAPVAAMQVNQMCAYLSELCLVDLSSAKHPLSLLSAAVLHVALTALGRADTYPHILARHSRYKLEEVLPAAR